MTYFSDDAAPGGGYAINSRYSGKPLTASAEFAGAFVLQGGRGWPLWAFQSENGAIGLKLSAKGILGSEGSLGLYLDLLRIFDASGVTECYRRKESILPQQALALAKGEPSPRMARRLARTLSDEIGPDRARFADAAFGPVLARPPTEAERAECLR